jgi:hypothetical protein
LLVCGYEDEAKCRAHWIDGALTLKQLQSREKGLPRDQNLIFYCA